MLAKVLCAAVLLATALAGGARADADFDLNAKGMALNDMKGRTMVGVTRDGSSAFGMHLGRDGKAEFTAASGKRSTGTWRQIDRVIVCLKGLVAERPSEEVCKRAPELGRGLDWMTVTLGTDKGKPTWAKATRDEHRGSSQMVYSLAGKAEVNRASYLPDVTKWAGHVIVGRTLKDREAWFAELKPGGRLDFVFASGKRFAGSYTLKPGEICMTFPDNAAANGCRKPTVKDRKVLWASSTDGGAVSEIVYMHKVAAPVSAPAKPAVVATPAPAPFGAREYAPIATSGQPYFVPSPDRTLLAAHDKDKRRLTLWNTLTGRQIGAIPNVADPGDVAWSPDGRQLGVLGETGVEVFDSATGRFLGAIAQAGIVPRFRQVALPDASSVLIGDADGRLTRHAFPGGAVLAQADLAAGAILDIAVNPQGRIGISTRDGKIAVLAPDLTVLAGLELRTASRPGRVDMSVDGRHLLAPSLDGMLHLINLTPGAATPIRSKAIPGGTLRNADLTPAGNIAVLGMGDKGVGFVSVPDLTLTGRWEVKSGFVSRATMLPRAAGVVLADTSGRLALWARDAAEASALAAMERASAAPERLAADRAKSAFDKGRALADADQKKTASAMTTAYFDGACAEYDRLSASARLHVRLDNCQAAATLRDKTRRFTAALAALDCDGAAVLATELGRTDNRVANCRAKAQRAADTRTFADAKAAGDCTTVRALAAKMSEPQAGADCDLALAMASGSPRRMFLSAVQLDTSGDQRRARALYTALMTRFPEDDLALDAARRLTALADMDKQKAAADTLAAQQATAVKAAEDRAKAAEAAARKAAEEADRRRKADARKAEDERKDRELSEKRLLSLRNLIAAMNQRYGATAGRVWISARVSGVPLSYEVSTGFNIRAATDSPLVSRDFCRVIITTSSNPLKRQGASDQRLRLRRDGRLILSTTRVWACGGCFRAFRAARAALSWVSGRLVLIPSASFAPGTGCRARTA